MVVVMKLSSFLYGALDELAERGICPIYAFNGNWFRTGARNLTAGIRWNQSAAGCVDLLNLKRKDNSNDEYFKCKNSHSRNRRI